jgi:hypothetical protein
MRSAGRLSRRGSLGIVKHPIDQFLKPPRRGSTLTKELVYGDDALPMIAVPVISLLLDMQGAIVILDQRPARIPQVIRDASNDLSLHRL